MVTSLLMCEKKTITTMVDNSPFPLFPLALLSGPSLSPKLPFEFELERVIDDFVFMCILVGNDFLPNTPHLDIADGALNHMMNMYKVRQGGRVISTRITQ